MARIDTGGKSSPRPTYAHVKREALALRRSEQRRLAAALARQVAWEGELTDVAESLYKKTDGHRPEEIDADIQKALAEVRAQTRRNSGRG